AQDQPDVSLHVETIAIRAAMNDAPVHLASRSTCCVRWAWKMPQIPHLTTHPSVWGRSPVPPIPFPRDPATLATPHALDWKRTPRSYWLTSPPQHNLMCARS